MHTFRIPKEHNQRRRGHAFHAFRRALSHEKAIQHPRLGSNENEDSTHEARRPDELQALPDLQAEPLNRTVVERGVERQRLVIHERAYIRLLAL